MAGQFSGLTPAIITWNSATTTNGDKSLIAKVQNTMTVTDTFINAQNSLSTSTTNWAMFRILNGGTTGSATTRIVFKGGSNGGAWTAMTPRQITTNFTLNAGQCVAVRYSEQGTVALGLLTIELLAVEGSV